MSCDVPSLLAINLARAHQVLGLSQRLITPSLSSFSISCLEVFSRPAEALGHVVLEIGLAPGLMLILIGATAAKLADSPVSSGKANG